MKIIDSLKQMVRFAAGLDEQKDPSEESQERTSECLAKFGERLRGFQPEQVHVVATNTFHVTKNIGRFIPKAETALGFPIEVIAGRREARLIYAGVAHTLPPNGDRILAVDTGGGSTEFVIGSDLRPTHTESLSLGCVTYSMRFFQSKIDNKDFQAAIVAARNEVQRIDKLVRCAGWDFAIGASGLTKSIRDVLVTEYPQEADITYGGMKKLAERITATGSVEKAKFENLKPGRVEVFTGGLAVIMAAFEELEIRRVTVTEVALRDGIFYDLIDRSLNEDVRGQATAEFQHRYHVNLDQANCVTDTAQKFVGSLCYEHNVPAQSPTLWKQYLSWVGRLHGIGLDVLHIGYHRRSAYILGNADIPGFSRREQSVLTQLVLGYRDEVRKMTEIIDSNEVMWYAILSLCLAALFCHARMPLGLPPFTQLRPDNTGKGFMLRISRDWLKQHPLIGDALAYESI